MRPSVLPTNEFLRTIGVREEYKCDECGEVETTKHSIAVCHKSSQWRERGSLPVEDVYKDVLKQKLGSLCMREFTIAVTDMMAARKRRRLLFFAR